MNRLNGLPLNAETAAIEQVGSKGQSLAKMLRAGLPVPDGFHVSADAYRAFVMANGLQPRILSALAGWGLPTPRRLKQFQ